MAQPTYQTITAGQIMSKALICAGPNQDLAEVEALLIEHRISGVPVVENSRLVGVVSRGDLARVQVLMNSLDGLVTDRLRWGNQADGFQHGEGADFQGFRQMLSKLRVRDAMHDHVVTCSPDSSVAHVAETMVRHHLHRIIVVEAEHPVGIISSLDLVKLIAEADSDAKRS